MNSSNLTLPQLQKLLNTALDDLERYAKFRLWLKEQGFPGDDPLVVCVDRAHAHLQDLRMHLHYEVCKRGGDGTRK